MQKIIIEHAATNSGKRYCKLGRSERGEKKRKIEGFPLKTDERPKSGCPFHPLVILLVQLEERPPQFDKKTKDQWKKWPVCQKKTTNLSEKLTTMLRQRISVRGERGLGTKKNAKTMEGNRTGESLHKRGFDSYTWHHRQSLKEIEGRIGPDWSRGGPGCVTGMEGSIGKIPVIASKRGQRGKGTWV